MAARVAVRFFALAVAVAVATSGPVPHALAAPAPSGEEDYFVRSMMDFFRIEPEEVVRVATGWLNELGLPGAVENVAWALLLVLFAGQAVHAAATANPGELWGLGMRLAVAGGLLTWKDGANHWIRRIFMESYRAGKQIWGKFVGPEFRESLRRYAGWVGAALSGTALAAMVTGIAGGNPVAQFIGLGEIADKVFSFIADMVLRSLQIWAVLMAVLVAFYMLLQFAAGMIVYLAQVFTPVAAAGLVHPATRDWFGRWLRMTIHAVLLVLMADLFFGLAVKFGMAEPFRRFDGILSGINLADALRNPTEFAGKVQTALTSLVLMPISVIIGLIFGVLGLWQAEGRVAAFIGSVAAGLPVWLPWLAARWGRPVVTGPRGGGSGVAWGGPGGPGGTGGAAPGPLPGWTNVPPGWPVQPVLGVPHLAPPPELRWHHLLVPPPGGTRWVAEYRPLYPGYYAQARAELIEAMEMRKRIRQET